MELSEFFNKNMQFMDNDEINQIVHECDTNQDGQINYQEFIDHIRGYQEEKLRKRLGFYIAKIGKKEIMTRRAQTIMDKLEKSERSKSEPSKENKQEIVEEKGKKPDKSEGGKIKKKEDQKYLRLKKKI